MLTEQVPAGRVGIGQWHFMKHARLWQRTRDRGCAFNQTWVAPSLGAGGAPH